nr:uncharacterized protein LOC113829178 [Penaeus vannamei]
MRRNVTFRFLARDHYLPEEVNFWTMAIVAVGTGFIFTVAVSIYLICQTRLERPLPVRHQRTVRHISQGPDAFLLPYGRPGDDLRPPCTASTPPPPSPAAWTTPSRARGRRRRLLRRPETFIKTNLQKNLRKPQASFGEQTLSRFLASDGQNTL